MSKTIKLDIPLDSATRVRQEHADYAEALRLIRKYMQPGDSLGQMFMRVAKALEAEGKNCDAYGNGPQRS